METGHFILNTRSFVNNEFLKEILHEIFRLEVFQINSILESRKTIITYEIRRLNDTVLVNDLDNNFCFEINLYIPREYILKTGLYNNLLLGIKFFSLLKQEILIYNQSDNPYLWILINDHVYLVDEIEGESNCVIIDKNFKRKLSLIKAINLLPGKDYYDLNEEIAYYVKDDKLWQNCIEE